LYYEVGLPEETLQGLTKRGHELFEVPKLPGGMNGVLMDESGVIHGASCWRSDGTPIGYSGGKAHTKGIIINDQF
jgi:gamma-glutamyltranspeptidase/glutathione hydrolase